MGEIELDAERQIVTEFLEELIKPSPKATYGEKMIRQALEQGAVAKLLISEGMRKNVVDINCNSCGHDWTVSVGRTDALPACPKCKADGDDLREMSSVSLIDEFSILAAKGRSEVKFISTDTEEGAQLASGFGGLAAVLRYPMM
jgi:peptide chain release factor subunit 1